MSFPLIASANYLRAYHLGFSSDRGIPVTNADAALALVATLIISHLCPDPAAIRSGADDNHV